MPAKFLIKQVTTARFLRAFELASQRLDYSRSDLQSVNCIVDEKKYNFHFIHRDQQHFDKVRRYRKTILESMNLNLDSPTLQIIGDSAPFCEERVDFAKQFLFDVLNKHPKHTILYGITGKSGDVNALVGEWIAQDITNQARSIGNAVNIHTPMAIKSWGCSVGSVFNVAVVYPDALFGADVELSDNFVPQYDNAPGASMGICMEGGVQSFLQSINMLHLNIPILAVEKLRGSSNASCKVDDKYLLFFSAAEFLNIIKKYVVQARAAGREASREDIEMLRDAYLYDPKIYGAYVFEKHKHLNLFANPSRHDYDTKMDLFVTAFDKFFQHRIWEKLELLNVVNCEEELGKRALAKSLTALLTPNIKSSSPIHQGNTKELSLVHEASSDMKFSEL